MLLQKWSQQIVPHKIESVFYKFFKHDQITQALALHSCQIYVVLYVRTWNNGSFLTNLSRNCPAELESRHCWLHWLFLIMVETPYWIFVGNYIYWNWRVLYVTFESSKNLTYFKLDIQNSIHTCWIL